MTPITFYIPCLFGLEGLVGDELRRLHLQDVRVENGHVLCAGTAADIARLNLNLRCGERVLILMGAFPAASFDALFERTRALPWENWIDRRGAFPVKGYSLESQLHSVPDCQKIVKKAIAARLGEKYGPCAAARGRREISGAVRPDARPCRPAAGYLRRGAPQAGLSGRGREGAPAGGPWPPPWSRCPASGARTPSATPSAAAAPSPSRAALIAKNRAPGLDRSFSAQKWRALAAESWMDAADEAMDGEFDGHYDIWEHAI